MIQAIVTSTIEHYLLYVAIILFLVGGVMTWIYMPIFGKYFGVAFFAAATAIGAYQLGYNARAQLDTSVELQKQLALTQAALTQAQADLKTNQDIAAASTAREQKATADASALQSKVENYEDRLKQQADDAGQPTVVTVPGKCPTLVHRPSGCLLTPSDVTGLRGITNRSAGH